MLHNFGDIGQKMFATLGFKFANGPLHIPQQNCTHVQDYSIKSILAQKISNKFNCDP